MIRRWRRLAAEALDRRFARLDVRLDAVDGRFDHSEIRLAGLEERLDRQTAQLERVTGMIRSLAADDPGHRRRLQAARAAPDYAAAWDEPDPLVTVAIPTRDRLRLLLERALPSALAQTHENLEVLVIGDAADPDVAAAVGALPDPRVRFVNLTHRFERQDGERWLTAATLSRNEGYRLARGRWLVDLDDDDALRPDAISALLEHARAHRLEAVYSRVETHFPDAPMREIGLFPPALGDFSWHGSVVHAGLRFFEREHVAADIGVPGDWFRVERMMRAGVRIGKLEKVTGDYYPGRFWPGG
ncbi:MAG TPA: glycosyltransferase [Thermoleophilaceae bacterium]|nr:glycosyltransferase [Thermoleophilaceae bacterium]